MFTCTLNPESKEPLREQLYAALRREIEAGSLAAGSRLPGKRELAQHLGVSANTAEAAYGALADEGLCEIRPRSGVYVLPRQSGVSNTHFSAVAFMT